MNLQEASEVCAFAEASHCKAQNKRATLSSMPPRQVSQAWTKCTSTIESRISVILFSVRSCPVLLPFLVQANHISQRAVLTARACFVASVVLYLVSLQDSAGVYALDMIPHFWGCLKSCQLRHFCTEASLYRPCVLASLFQTRRLQVQISLLEIFLCVH